MNIASNKKGLLLLALAALLALIAIVRSLAPEPAAMEEISDPGVEELTQIYGSVDASDGSGEGSAEVPATEGEPGIGGQVVQPTGEPARGAAVSATSMDGRVHEAVADSGGMFHFYDLDVDQRYVIEASQLGYGPAIAIGVAVGQTEVRLVLESGREVEGLVTHRDEPVPHAVVHLGGPGTFPQRSVVADSSGRFTVSGLRPGAYEVIATAEGYGSGFGGRMAIDDPEGETLRLDIPVYTTPTTTISVVDSLTSEPVAVAVIAIADGPLHVLSLHEVAEGGVTDVNFLPRGDYFVRVRSPGYLPYEGTVSVSGSGGDLVLPLSRGATIRGSVADTVGNPISHASLTAVVVTTEGARWELRRTHFDDFHRLVRPDGTPFWWSESVFYTDETGRFELSGLPAGAARITVMKSGWATVASNEIRLDPDRVFEPLNLTMEAGRRLRGRVEDGAGGAVSGAFVSARPERVPAWASPVGLTTPRNGVFEIEDLPESVILAVRHPEFAATEVRLEIPETGLDDVIVRLSGEQLPAVRGRLYTSQGAPAVGALIWLMEGESQLPACQATVGADAWFTATHCTAQPERLIASYPDHAPLVAELTDAIEPQDWELPLGGELEILSQRTPVVADVIPSWPLPPAHWHRPQLSLDGWSRDLVRHVPAGSYQVRCTADGHEEGEITVAVQEGERTEAVCPALSRMVEFPIYVVDPQGARVGGAVVFVDRTDPPIRTISDENGRVMVRSRPGIWLDGEAMHEEWGRGYLRFFAHYEEQTNPPRIELGDPIGGDEPEALAEELTAWGVSVVPDGRSLLLESVADQTPAAAVGLRRLDHLLWARPVTEFRYSIGVRRNGELLTFELVREPDGE